MIRKLIQQFCLSLCLLGAVTLAAGQTAFAQSPADHKISRIEKALETAKIDIPTNVMSELKDIIIEIEALKAHQGRLYHQNLYRGGKNLQHEDIKELPRLENEFYASDDYKENQKQQAQARQKGRDLLEPFFNLPPSSLARPDFKGLTAEEQTQALLKLYKDLYEHQGTPISEADLAELEDITRSKQELNAQLLPRLRQSKSAEYERLKTEIRELNRRQQHILNPYQKTYNARLKAKQRVLLAFAEPLRAPTAEDKLERNFEREIKKYTEHHITISDDDAQKMKNLMREGLALQEEASRFRLGGTDVQPAQMQAYKARYEKLLQTSEALMKPYEEQLKAAKKKR